MSIERPQGTPEGANVSARPTSGRAGKLGTALRALIIATAGLTATGCDNEKKPSELTPAPTATASADAGAPDQNRALPPSGEQPLDKMNLQQYAKNLFDREHGTPAFAAMESGGSRPYAHFKLGERVRAIRVSTDAEIPAGDITQVKCTDTKGKPVTDLFIKSQDNLFRLPDCERDEIKSNPKESCVTAKFPYTLTAEQKKSLTFVNREANEEQLPDDARFQIAQLWPGKKPGCGEGEAVATVTPPTPPRTYNYVPSRKYVLREDYDNDRAEQAERDSNQDAEIAKRAYQKDLDNLKEYWKCHNADGTMKQVCKEANQAIADQGSKPKNQ